jgi:hypothetical protein
MGSKAATGSDLEGEDEEEKADSEDELAPTQPAKSESARKVTDQRRAIAPGRTAQLSPNSGQLQLRQAMPVSSPLMQPPMTPNPAANLLQFVHFPQTPAGQQAQTSFYATLTQTINHAVQQAVAPLFSGVMPKTPAVQLPFPNALPFSTTTPIISLDKVPPATDPKWYFPPLPEKSREPEVAHSSPIVKPASSPTQRAGNKQYEPQLDTPTRDITEEDGFSIAGVNPREGTRTTAKSKKTTVLRTKPRVEIPSKGRPSPLAKYIFTQEDDIHIAKLKMLQNLTWAEVRNSQQKWASWPIWAFSQRWSKRLKGKNLHLKEATTLFITQTSPRDSQDGTVKFPPVQLPTPSGSEPEDRQTSVIDASTDTLENVTSSSTHFDDDDAELLSLGGVEEDDAEPEFVDAGGEPFVLDPDEMIMPSVEITEFVNEDALQQGLLEGSPMEDATTTPVKIKQEPQYSSPPKKQKRTQIPITYQPMPDSDTEADLDDTGSAPPRPQEQSTFLCDICTATFQNMDQLDQHRTNLHTARKQPRPKSASLDLVGDHDELQASTPKTPHIKREPSTPPLSFLLSTPLAKSRSHADLRSPGVKSASGLSRWAYHKQVKQAWAKKSTPAPKTVTKRRSFHSVPKKRAWVESEDELGL